MKQEEILLLFVHGCFCRGEGLTPQPHLPVHAQAFLIKTEEEEELQEDVVLEEGSDSPQLQPEKLSTETVAS